MLKVERVKMPKALMNKFFIENQKLKLEIKMGLD